MKCTIFTSPPPQKEEKEEEKGRHKVTSDEWPTSCEWPFASGSIFMPQNLRALQLTLSACPINVCEHCSSLSLHAPSMSVSTAAHSLCMPHQCLQLTLSACPINVCEHCSSLSLHAPSMSVSTAAHSLCTAHQCLWVLQPLHALSMSVSTAALCMRHQCLWVLQLSACPINVCEHCSSIHAPSMSVSTAALSLCMLHQCLWALHLSLSLSACPNVCKHCSSLHAPSVWVLPLSLHAPVSASTAAHCMPHQCEYCSSVSLHAPVSASTAAHCMPHQCEYCHSHCMPHQCLWALQLTLLACPNVCEHCSSLHAPMSVSTAAHCMPQCLWALQLTACPNVCEHCSSLHAPMSVSTAAHCMPQCLWALQLTACPNVCKHCSSLTQEVLHHVFVLLSVIGRVDDDDCDCGMPQCLLSATVYNPHVKTQSCLWTWPNIHRAASAEVSCALHPVWMGHLSCCTDLVSLSVFSSSLCTAYILYIIYTEYTSFFITPHPTHTHLSSCHDLNKWKAKRHIPPPKNNNNNNAHPYPRGKMKGRQLSDSQADATLM